jgi:hypothetical protein
MLLAQRIENPAGELPFLGEQLDLFQADLFRGAISSPR